MHRGNLIPGPLPFVEPGLWLRQAQEPRHRLFYSDNPTFSGGPNALPQPVCHLVVGPDPGLLKRRAERRWMCLCVSAGWQQRAQAAEGTILHLWSTSLQGNAPAMDWSTCYFAVEIFISPSTLPSVLRPWFGRSSQDAVRGSVESEASSPLHAHEQSHGTEAVCTDVEVLLGRTGLSQ
jgi:hypothetical protein